MLVKVTIMDYHKDILYIQDNLEIGNPISYKDAVLAMLRKLLLNGSIVQISSLQAMPTKELWADIQINSSTEYGIVKGDTYRFICERATDTKE